jgi:hypothetical protein
LGGALGCSFQRLRFGHRRAVLFRCRDLHRIVSLLHTRDRQGTVPTTGVPVPSSTDCSARRSFRCQQSNRSSPRHRATRMLTPGDLHLFAGPTVCRLAAGGKQIRTAGPTSTETLFGIAFL